MAKPTNKKIKRKKTCCIFLPPLPTIHTLSLSWAGRRQSSELTKGDNIFHTNSTIIFCLHKADTASTATAPSLHSRAARRATSPSIDTDKSLKTVRPPAASLNQRPSVLGLHQNAGVSKKASRGRKAVRSTRARRRHERGLERAEEIVDRTANKIAKSKRAASHIAERKKAWEDVNGSVGKNKVGSSNMFAGLAAATGGDDEEDDEEDGWEDDEGGDDEMADAAPAAPKTTAAVAPPAPGDDDDEEIL